MKLGVIVMWIVYIAVAFAEKLPEQKYLTIKDVFCGGSALPETTARSDLVCAGQCRSDAQCVAYSRRDSQCVLHYSICSSSDLLPEAGARYAEVQWYCVASSCYYVPTLRIPRNKAGAQADCEKLGAHVLMIETAEENELVKQLIVGFKLSWINAENKGGKWMHNGEPLKYTNWFTAHDSWPCAIIWYDGTWNNQPCSSAFPFLCEK